MHHYECVVLCEVSSLQTDSVVVLIHFINIFDHCTYSIIETLAKYILQVCVYGHFVFLNFVHCQQSSSSSNITTKSVKTSTDD